MASVEQVEAWVTDFEREFPEELPDRLRWFVQKLGVKQSQLLRLMGLSPEVVKTHEHGEIDWQWAIQEYGEDRAAWADEVICDTLALYRYDWRALQQRLSTPIDKEFPVLLPGGTAISLGELPCDEREKMLLYLIAERGGRASQALIALLSQPILCVAAQA